jgi:hypothetical protein
LVNPQKSFADGSVRLGDGSVAVASQVLSLPSAARLRRTVAIPR